MVFIFLALFIGVPLVWHWFSFDRAEVSARSALLLGVGSAAYAWLRQSWYIGVLVFFLVTLLEFAVAYAIGLAYAFFASAARTDYLERARSAREQPNIAEPADARDASEPSPTRSPRLAIGGLAGLLLLEALAMQFPVGWIADAARDHFSWSGTIHELAKCSPEVTLLKSQHFALSAMFIPLKVAFLFLLWPASIRAPMELGLGARVWSGFVFALYCLVGLVPAYVVLVIGLGSSRPSGSSFVLTHLYRLCDPPTMAYLGSSFFESLVVAICFWPICVAIVSLARKIRAASA